MDQKQTGMEKSLWVPMKCRQEADRQESLQENILSGQEAGQNLNSRYISRFCWKGFLAEAS